MLYFTHNLLYLRHVSISLDHLQGVFELYKSTQNNTEGLLNTSTVVREMSVDVIKFVCSSV
jgi:hypothetical protein